MQKKKKHNKNNETEKFKILVDFQISHETIKK
jgi:hypothetical protein